MYEHILKAFMVIIILSMFTFLQRADYNLPLYGFAALLWHQNESKNRLRFWYLMAFSLITDAIWIIYWVVIWGKYENPEVKSCQLTYILSLVSFILKIIITTLIMVKDPLCQNAITDIWTNFKIYGEGIIGSEPTGYKPPAQ